MNEVEMKIRDYVADLFRRHDLNILSSEKKSCCSEKGCYILHGRTGENRRTFGRTE